MRLAARPTLALTLAAAVLGSALVLGPSPQSARAQEKTEEDPIFRALSDELARASTLRMEDLDEPYHVQGYVNDSESFNVSASFGALTSKGGGRSASLSTDVRVGSADLDNTNFSSFGGWGGGATTPAEPDYDALRQALWLSFDSSFKAAVSAIAKKRAYLATNNVKQRLPDFGPAPVEDVVLPRQELVVDKDRWAAAVRRISAVFREYPQVHLGDVSFAASVSHQYFVTTEPTRHRFATPHCSISMRAATQCEDGMYVSATYYRETGLQDGLPKIDQLVKQAHLVAKRATALAEAPTADDYWGPVLFLGEAAPKFFLETIGNPLSHARQDLGSSVGGRLIDRMDRRIASKLVTVRDDPTLTEWKGQTLLGHFPVDDDGVKPLPVTLIDKGFLRTYFTSRVPTKHVKKTNGHSRAGEGSAGNLFIETSEGSSHEQLEAKLLELVAEEDLPYGLIVQELSGAGSFSFGSSRSIRLPTPSVVYRLYRDGRRELVRGAAFQPASYRVLRDIVALGDEPVLLNTTQFSQRVSVVAPAVLVSELELRRPREEFSKPPYSERPGMKR